MSIFSTDPFKKKESEKATEAYLNKLVKSVGGLSYKWVSPNNAGVPDRICLFKTALCVYVEVKSEGRKPTELQLRVHEQLRALDFLVYVVDTKAQVDTLIQDVKLLMKRRTLGAYS